MSDSTTPPPPTTDPTASAREWAGLSPTAHVKADSVIGYEIEVAHTSRAPKVVEALTIARRVLADAPALLARLEEAEATSEGRLEALREKAEEAREQWLRAERTEADLNTALKALAGQADKVAALEARLAEEVETRLAVEIGTRQAAQARVIALAARLAEVAPVVEAAERLDAVAEEIDDYSFFIDAAAKRPEVEAYWQAVNAVEDEVEALRAARAKREGGGA